MRGKGIKQKTFRAGKASFYAISYDFGAPRYDFALLYQKILLIKFVFGH